ncbi:hypothetical protein E3P99_03283 [Wallemia hederae]|uniref:F-box domain-containing protein n=1 Tax=Wallemia hederae TaxID=1540922 RepID=A0A4T0FGR4_9BASI|nr:hypothetical protein E3P99_03283 [Wallemia hederae]
MLSRNSKLRRNQLGYSFTCHIGKLPTELLQIIVDLSPISLTMTCKSLRILSYEDLFKTLNVTPPSSHRGISRFVPVTPLEISQQYRRLNALLRDARVCSSVEVEKLRLNMNGEVSGDAVRENIMATSLLVANKLINVTTLEIALDDLVSLSALPNLHSVTTLRIGFARVDPVLVPNLASTLKSKYANVVSVYISFGHLVASTLVNRWALQWIELFRDALYEQEFDHLRTLWVECDFCHLHTVGFTMQQDDRVFRDHIYWCRDFK